MLGNTLAASFIWGINTIFLLDAGLSNAEAFAANAFFTAGMVLFEVPTGIVADTIGRRVSYLLGTVTLTLSTVLYVALWHVEAPFWEWAAASILLGLGFTFFSGAVEAWLVDALAATGFRGELETVFGRGQIVSGIAMLTGSVAGGLIAQATSLGVPFVVRAGVLAVMFVVAWRLMHDVGFTPQKGQRPLPEMRRIAVGLDRVRLARPGREVADARLAVQRRRRHLRVLRAAALPARALRRPNGLLGRRPGGRDRGRGADPRRNRRTADPPPVSPSHLGAGRDVGPGGRGAGADRGDRELRRRDRADRRLGPVVRGRDADPPGLHQRHDPVEAAGDDPLLRLVDELNRRRLGPARARPCRRRLGLRALVPAERGDRRPGPAVHLAIAAPGLDRRTRWSGRRPSPKPRRRPPRGPASAESPRGASRPGCRDASGRHRA